MDSFIKLDLVISESKNYIILTCQASEDVVLSWEDLQGVKDHFYPNLDFFEIYPKTDEIINKANERHLVHQKGFKMPKMADFEENDAYVVVVENYILTKN